MAGCPTLKPLGMAYLSSHSGPALLCCKGMVQGLLSPVLQQMRGRDGSPALITLGSALPPAVGGKGQGKVIFLLPMSLYMAGKGQDQLFNAHTLRACSIMPLPSGSALLCCLNDMQGCSSPAFMAPALPPALGGGG